MLEQETRIDPATWQADLEAAICESCDWRYLRPAGSLPQQCPHCFQSELTSLPELAEAERAARPPELVLPFTVSEEHVSQMIQAFASGIRFAPVDLTPQNLLARLQKVYLPMWLVDSDVAATWQAEVGFDYEAISHRDRFDQNRGGWVSEEITETRIRWEPRLGRLTRHYDNIVAPALEEHASLQQRLGPYELTTAQPYQPQAVAGCLIRLPNRPPADAWPEAVPELHLQASDECRRACQGDHFRDFRWQADYQGHHWTLLLLPVYTTFYRDDTQTPIPILIHGQAGRLSGRRQASMKQARRATLMIIAVAVVIFALSLVGGLVAYFFAEALVTLALLGGFLAFAVGLAGLLPLLLVWQFNRAN